MSSCPVSPCLADPWSWAPDFVPWYGQVARVADNWTSSVRLSVPGGSVAELIHRAASQNEKWLYHPCLSALLLRHQDGCAARDIALLGWIAHHAHLEGELLLDNPHWCWSTDGGFLLPPGSHTFTELTERMHAGGAPEIALDPWCTLLGYAHPGTWADFSGGEEQQTEGIRAGTMIACRASALLSSFLPEVMDWLKPLAHVLIFLDGEGDLARSSSYAEMPGVIFADTRSELALIEVLVHESAHHLLYIEEAGGPLIDPHHTTLYPSPLRSDLRPLRGILLAYHALAYICAFYSCLSRSPLGEDVLDSSDVADLQLKMRQAGTTLRLGSSGLTSRGIAFLERTDDVALYSF